MADGDNKLTFWGFFKTIIKAVVGIALFLQAMVFIFIMIVFVAFIGGIATQMGGGGNQQGPSLKVPEGAALVLDPAGVLVEQAAAIDPFEQALSEAYGAGQPPQVEVHDIIRVIRAARDDSRIKAMVLDLGQLYVPSYAASKLHDIAAEIDAFKESGKTVVAVGDYYSQEQYLLASHADHIMLHDYGSLLIYGYGSYGTYLKSLFERFNVTNHEFRVGTYKSALEPYTRDDMSEPAKEANRAYLSVLWREYTSGIEAARGLPAGAIASYADDAVDIIDAAGGDLAMAAMNVGLVDELRDREGQKQYLIDLVGKDRDGKSFKGVGFRTYLVSAAGPENTAAPDVAVVTAAGTIVDGDQPFGVAAGDTIARYLKQAREDDNVKAVVLRVDSPGGSAFASEVMRSEVLALQEAGKPVVVSMGSLAASGGYWISAGADEIWAAPTTITGSIGIFGFVQTFENTVGQYGVYTDGVGTTDLSPIIAAGIGPLPEEFGAIIQRSTENGYDRFLTIVSNGRDLTKQEVDAIGQGRVWIGETALDIGLVDKLGSLDDAVAAAAALAGIEGDYDLVEMHENKSRFEKFLESLAAESDALFKGKAADETELFGSYLADYQQPALKQMIQKIASEARYYEAYNDPNNLYVRCLECEL
ncbi:signal peptide peptidase SppA [Aquisalinus flavus]|uniref:Protease n=1 Tax=Aquisalinus flavus TaxID=1526572 RepID=A0A8J2V4H9_9PROT|nr:signal peptide peptidase SppA [Aquisalinus flavus]MBD0426847.1 signal peptide peptidase SppA [Aquisalinus flavus]UNE46694.1 signal peptide peptidase SppA [Aquisalinus flavus]GGC96459.1 protease [Aquisalinus flavus]